MAQPDCGLVNTLSLGRRGFVQGRAEIRMTAPGEPQVRPASEQPQLPHFRETIRGSAPCKSWRSTRKPSASVRAKAASQLVPAFGEQLLVGVQPEDPIAPGLIQGMVARGGESSTHGKSQTTAPSFRAVSFVPSDEPVSARMISSAAPATDCRARETLRSSSFAIRQTLRLMPVTASYRIRQWRRQRGDRSARRPGGGALRRGLAESAGAKSQNAEPQQTQARGFGNHDGGIDRTAIGRVAEVDQFARTGPGIATRRRERDVR